MDRLWVRAGSNWKAPACAPRGKCPRRAGVPGPGTLQQATTPRQGVPNRPGSRFTVHTVSPNWLFRQLPESKSLPPLVFLLASRRRSIVPSSTRYSVLLRTHVGVLTMNRVHGVRTPTHGRLLLLPSKLPSRLDLQLAATKRCGSQAQRLPDQSMPVAGWATAPGPRFPCRSDKHPPFSRTCSFMKLTSDPTA